MASEDRTLRRESVLAQLERILSSREFDASERNRRFLRYVIDETLSGRADRIKAYSVATSVFDRDMSFDPQTDPIIRIEASRLRRSLERYYLTAGRADPVQITIPKGSYVPRFDSPQVESALSATPSAGSEPVTQQIAAKERGGGLHHLPRALVAASVAILLALTLLGVAWFRGIPPFARATEQPTVARHGPAIFVAPFEDDDIGSGHRDLARGFTREIISGLTRFDNLFVFAPATSFHYTPEPDSRKLATDLGVDYVLVGGLSALPDRLNVTASLIEAKTGRYLWSEKFDGSLAAADLFKIKGEIADRVVQALAQPYGIIYSERVKEIQGKPPQSLTSYECVLHFYGYWRSLTKDLFREVRGCLERAIASEPDYAEALASLALVYADAYRFKFASGEFDFDPLARAMELARRAVALAPNSARGYQALALVYWLTNDVQRSLEAGENGFALNPNNTEMMADLGFRYCLRGNWDKGLPLVEDSFARNPAEPNTYRVATFLHYYITGRYDEALGEAKKLEFPDVIYSHMALAIAYGQLGREREAGAAVKQILEIDPAYADHAIQDLQKRNLYPDLVRVIVDGLRKAGLAIKDQDLAHQQRS